MNDIDTVLRDAGSRLRHQTPTPEAVEAALAALADVRLDPTTSTSRRRLWIVGPAIVAAAAVTVGIVALTGSSRDAIVPADTTTPTVTRPAPTTPTTVTSPPATTVTSPPGTTVTSPPPATVAPTPPAVPWTATDGAGFVADPCCGSAAEGPASPELTSDGPLADGRYPVEVVEWSPDEPTRLVLDVYRFVPCADGLRDCSPDADGTYPPEAFGRSPSLRRITITLDASVTAVVAGIDPAATSPDLPVGDLRRSDGVALARLLAALAAGYDEVFAGPIAAGASPDEIVAGLAAAPRSGFTSAREDRTGEVYFSADDAPGVLLQSVSVQGAPLERSGTSGIDLGGITVADGAVTLYYVAGFRS